MALGFRGQVVLHFAAIFAPIAVLAAGFEISVPLGLPSPVPFPATNPPTAEKVELGRLLFFDRRLSLDGTVACASCHIPAHGWSDGRARAQGIHGLVGDRNTPSLYNRAYGKRQFWDGRADSLETQIPFPVTHPGEMGESIDTLVHKLNRIGGYRERFVRAFGRVADSENLGQALASFERTILTGDAPYDRDAAGDAQALSPAARRGKALFFKRFRCDTCHAGPNFTNEEVSPRCYPQFVTPGGAGPVGTETFMGRFKTPSLRNVARTAPYLHDGALKSLEDVIDFYNRSGPLPARFGDRKEFPAIEMSRAERDDLVAFLRALTGSEPAIEIPRVFPQ